MEVMGAAPPPGSDPISQLRLPPGFRFYPTDEELLVQYLCRKVAGYNFSLQVIGDIDLYKFDPWVLPDKAIFGEKEWYFFSPRDRKYPNGSRPNRVAGSGYWKATGTDKVITTQGRRVGIKKALVFYVGKAPRGIKTNWIMHEYRLVESAARRPPHSSSTKLDDWVLCRIYKKSSGTRATTDLGGETSPSSNFPQNSSGGGGGGISNSSSSSSSHMDDVMESINDERFFSSSSSTTTTFKTHHHYLKTEPQQLEQPPSLMKPPMTSTIQPLTHQQQQQQHETDDGSSRLGLLYSFGSGSIDWNALMGLTSSGPDDLISLGLGEDDGPQFLQQTETDQQQQLPIDMCVPSLPPLCHVEEKHQLLQQNLMAKTIGTAADQQRAAGWFGGPGYDQMGGGSASATDPFGRRFDCSNQMSGLYGLRH